MQLSTWYLDDVNPAGTKYRACLALQFLDSLGPQRGLHMNPHSSYIMTHTNGGLPSGYTMVLACNCAAWIGCRLARDGGCGYAKGPLPIGLHMWTSLSFSSIVSILLHMCHLMRGITQSTEVLITQKFHEAPISLSIFRVVNDFESYGRMQCAWRNMGIFYLEAQKNLLTL